MILLLKSEMSRPDENSDSNNNSNSAKAEGRDTGSDNARGLLVIQILAECEAMVFFSLCQWGLLHAPRLLAA